MKLNIKYKSGFTLLELLTTVGIIIVLTALAVPSFNKYGRSNELIQVGNVIKSGLLSTQSYAINPTVNKKSGVDKYSITFDSTIPGYSIYETQVTGDVAIETYSFSKDDYQLILPGSANTFKVEYSISEKGKIVSPANSVQIELLGKKVTGADKIYISINPLSGEISASGLKE